MKAKSESKLVFKVSPSSLSLMENCFRCFWLDKHKVWKRPKGGFPTLPSGIDSLLKKHFNKFRDRGLLPPELYNNHDCKNLRLYGATYEEKERLKKFV